MTFATKADMIARFGQRKLTEMTDRSDPPADVIDDAVLAIGLSDADAMISQALLSAAIKPAKANVVIDVLVSIACDIALYRLADLPIERDRAKHPIEKRYDQAVIRLEMIAAGRMDVPGCVSINDTDTAANGIAIGTKRALFGADFDAQYRTDTNRVNYL